MTQPDIKIMLIGGTLAPAMSQGFYYNLLINALEQLGHKVVFVSIDKLGLGDIDIATQVIASEHLIGKKTKWIVLGHSQGGKIAALLGARYYKKVWGVITLAAPLLGTTWTDPLSMPVRLAVEGINHVFGVKLHFRIPKLVMPLPVVKGMRHHGPTSEELVQYWSRASNGPLLFTFVGKDYLVLPNRAAHIAGEQVTAHLVGPLSWLAQLPCPDHVIPLHTDDFVGHRGIVRNEKVIAQVVLCAQIAIDAHATQAQSRPKKVS